jgi:four helix bundle protein
MVNMARIKQFKDIEAWQKARELTRAIYAETALGKLSRDFGLRDQMRRAAVSILCNVAEGFERGGDKEFVQFIAIAKGSSAEVRAQLYVALDQGYIDQETFDRLSASAIQINRMLSGLMKYLRTSDYKGSKFK